MIKPHKPTIKPCTAWALVDPDDWRIQPHMIFDEHVRNGGRGSITDGWKCIRVKITAVKKVARK
jgi:hypothetical protein